MINRVAAIIVVFNPSEDLCHNINQLAKSVSRLIVVDNTLDGSLNLPIDGFDLIRNYNRACLAGAYNVAIDFLNSNATDIQYVIFVDDDTNCSTVGALLTSDRTIYTLNEPATAAVSPQYIDKNTGVYGGYILLSRFKIKYLDRPMRTLSEVSFLINSLSIWKLDVLNSLGKYDESLMIDHIDTDMSLRAKLNGFKLYVNPEVEYIHEIGNRKKYRFLLWQLQSGGHSPERRYLIAKNTMILARRNFFKFPSFVVLCVKRVVYEALGVICVEDSKYSKLRSLVRGFLSGLFAR
mgnify:CR=1 FL=1